MSADTVNVPREPTEAMLDAFYGAVEVLRTGTIRGFLDGWEAVLAASPSVGGWGEDARDISGETVMGMRVAAYRHPIDCPAGTDPVAWTDFFRGDPPNTYSEHWSTPGAHRTDVERLFTEADVRARFAPPPPSVSTGSRPQEAVPTEQADGAVVEPCYECGSTERVGTACKPCNPEINNPSFGFSDGYRERLFQMIVDCEANPECDLMLSSSVAAEHAADLRAALSELSPQPAEGCSEKPVLSDRREMAKGVAPRTDPVLVLRETCQRLLDDYQTSEAHHPNHVLVLKADFEALRKAADGCSSNEGAA